MDKLIFIVCLFVVLVMVGWITFFVQPDATKVVGGALEIENNVYWQIWGFLECEKFSSKLEKEFVANLPEDVRQDYLAWKTSKESRLWVTLKDMSKRDVSK